MTFETDSKMTVDEIIDDILQKEGGYVDHADDKGGATNHGLSLRYMAGIGLDLDGDGDIDKDDVKLVAPDVARTYYRRDFYSRPRLDLLPVELQAQMFDFAVNSGPGRAIITLQEVLNAIRDIASDIGSTPLKPDGAIGPKTRGAAARAHMALGPYLTNAISEAREGYMRAIVDRDPSQGVFLNGWVSRARSFRVEIPT